MTQPTYLLLLEHYEACFAAHGATAKGVDWPNEADAILRHTAMLGVIRPGEKNSSLLDLGCGYGAFKDFLEARQLGYDYTGIDLSAAMIEAARARHPGAAFEVRDILREPLPENSVDYVVMNGVFTEKRTLSFEQMERFVKALAAAAFQTARRGIAFNVMNHHADFYRDDLFYWPFERAAAFITSQLSRHFRFRADYGLYDYTIHVYREPVA